MICPWSGHSQTTNDFFFFQVLFIGIDLSEWEMWNLITVHLLLVSNNEYFLCRIAGERQVLGGDGERRGSKRWMAPRNDAWGWEEGGKNWFSSNHCWMTLRVNQNINNLCRFKKKKRERNQNTHLMVKQLIHTGRRGTFINNWCGEINSEGRSGVLLLLF